MRKQKGITLIALVITIIVLLILAGVTIVTLTGDNGLLDKTKSAADKYSESEELEQIQLAVLSVQMKNKSNLTKENLNIELQEIFNNGIEVRESTVGWEYDIGRKYNIYKDGSVKRSIIPIEYQQVEYIESTGTSDTYMVLEINPLSKIKQFEISFNDPIVVEDNQYHFFPFFGTNNVNDTRASYNIDTGKIYGSFGNMSYGSNAPYINNQINRIYGESGKIVINNSEYDVTPGENSNSVRYTGLFCVTHRGASNIDQFYLKYKLYEFKFNNGTLLNLIPCYARTTVTNVKGKQCSAGTIGLYDTVEGKFYTNQGSGTFLKGNDV